MRPVILGSRAMLIMPPDKAASQGRSALGRVSFWRCHKSGPPGRPFPGYRRVIVTADRPGGSSLRSLACSRFRKERSLSGRHNAGRSSRRFCRADPRADRELSRHLLQRISYPAGDEQWQGQRSAKAGVSELLVMAGQLRRPAAPDASGAQGPLRRITGVGNTLSPVLRFSPRVPQSL